MEGAKGEWNAKWVKAFKKGIKEKKKKVSGERGEIRECIREKRVEKIEKIEEEKRKEGKEGRRRKNERKIKMKEREEKRRSVNIEVEIIKRIRKIETGIEGKEEELWVRLETERTGKYQWRRHLKETKERIEDDLPRKERKMKWKIEEIEKEENKKRKGRKKNMGWRIERGRIRLRIKWGVIAMGWRERSIKRKRKGNIRKEAQGEEERTGEKENRIEREWGRKQGWK